MSWHQYFAAAYLAGLAAAIGHYAPHLWILSLGCVAWSAALLRRFNATPPEDSVPRPFSPGTGEPAGWLQLSGWLVVRGWLR